MADLISPLINQLASIVSVKTSVRLIVIVFCIVLSWIYITPYFEILGLPSELRLPLIPVIGLAIGALITAIFFAILDAIISRITNHKKSKADKAEKLKQDEIKKAQIENRVNVFKQSFESYPIESKNIISELLLKDSAISESRFSFDNHNKAMHGLLSNGTIIELHRIDKTTRFCTINHIYRDFLKDYFDKQYSTEVSELFDNFPNELAPLMTIFSNHNLPENNVFDIGVDIYRYRYHFTPVIKHEEYDDNDDSWNIQFYIPDQYYALVNSRYGNKLREYFLGNFNESREHTPKC